MSQHSENIAVWFEIPAIQLDRAIAFYETLFEFEIEPFDAPGLQQGLFPHDVKTLVSGAIVCGEGYKPSEQGSVIYLNGGNDLATILSKVETAGGKVICPKTHLGDDIGHIAQFIDSEGNRIGLHSMH